MRNGIDIRVLKDTIPLPLIPDNAEDSLALVKKGNNKVKTTLARGNLVDPKQCDCVAGMDMGTPLEEKITEDKSWVYDGEQETAREEEFPGVVFVQIPIGELQFQSGS